MMVPAPFNNRTLYYKVRRGNFIMFAAPVPMGWEFCLEDGTPVHGGDYIVTPMQLDGFADIHHKKVVSPEDFKSLFVEVRETYE